MRLIIASATASRAAIAHWFFEKKAKSIEVAVKGTLIVGDSDLAIRAALDGVGIARVPITSVAALIAKKRLMPLLQDWAPRSVGFYLDYPSRRQIPAALRAFVDFLKAHARERDGAALPS